MITKNSTAGGFELDEIGLWSEIKLEIVRKYAQAYVNILNAAELRYSYIDGFAGAGLHLSQGSGRLVPGSPLNAVAIKPPFYEYFLVELDPTKVHHLKSLPEVKSRPEVHVIQGDCNEVLPNQVFPKVECKDFRRALCVLDPYGMHLNWKVAETAGRMKSVDILMNFPIMDMNRNALRLRPDRVTVEAETRMTAFWGDESWKQVAYKRQQQFFGEDDQIKLGNEEIVGAFANRLKVVGGFEFVPKPLPMKNSTGSIVYYLFFGSQKRVASNVFKDIVKKYTNTGAT